MTTTEMMHAGIKLVETGNFNEGLNLISQAIMIDPDDPEKRQVRGIFYNSAGYYQEAISDFNECILIRDDQFEYHYNLANVYYDMKMFGIALVYYTSAIKLNENDSDIYTNRGMCHLQNNDKEHALNDFKKALSINPGDEIAKQYLTYIF